MTIETLKQLIKPEVFEKIGLIIANEHYKTLLLAFFAIYVSTEIGTPKMIQRKSSTKRKFVNWDPIGPNQVDNSEETWLWLSKKSILLGVYTNLGLSRFRRKEEHSKWFFLINL